MLDRLLILQERGRSLINQGRAVGSVIISDTALRDEIDALYRFYFGRTLTGCKNCYADALVELCTLTKQKIMEKSELFVMRRGKVLRDTVTNDARKNLVRGNETDELALYHLHTNKNAADWFEKLPDEKTLKKMLDDFAKTFEAGKTATTDDGPTVAETAEKIIADAKAEAEKIIAEAVAEAEKIIAEAVAEAITGAKLIEESEAETKAEAEKIIADAKAEAEKIINDAKAATEPVTPATKATKTAAKADPIMD